MVENIVVIAIRRAAGAKESAIEQYQSVMLRDRRERRSSIQRAW
jgi:hypothetical protein